MRQDKIREQLNDISNQLQTINRFSETSEKIISIKKDTEEIKAHLKRLNGTVALHQNKIQGLELWKSNLNGRIKIISIILTMIVLPFVLYFLEKLIH